MIIRYSGEEHKCENAIRSNDELRLYDDSGMNTVTWSGISDFEAFTVEDGEITEAVSELTIDDIAAALADLAEVIANG